jgi:hypothetical protein
MYFTVLYENKRMHPVKIVLRREGTMRENDAGGKPN